MCEIQIQDSTHEAPSCSVFSSKFSVGITNILGVYVSGVWGASEAVCCCHTPIVF